MFQDIKKTTGGLYPFCRPFMAYVNKTNTIHLKVWLGCVS